MISDGPMPWEYWRWQFAYQYGWTLEYIDGLSVGDTNEKWQVDDGVSKALKSPFMKK